MARVAPDAAGLSVTVATRKNPEPERMNRLRLFTIPSLAFCGLCIAACCFGGGDGDLASIHIRQLTIGFSGKYKIGSWAPVYITLEAPAGEPLVLELTVPDGDGVPTTTTAKSN